MKPSIASLCATKNRSGEEWLTSQVVLDVLSLRQLAGISGSGVHCHEDEISQVARHCEGSCQEHEGEH